MNIMALEKLQDSFLGSDPKTGNSDGSNDTDQELDNVYICQNEQLIISVDVLCNRNSLLQTELHIGCLLLVVDI